MKIILTTDVLNLGEEGDIKVVADGYARNYLIPNKFAVLCNKANLTVLEQRKRTIEKIKEEKRKAALSLKEKIESEELIVKMPTGEKGKLFGSVNNATVVEELTKKGISVERKKVEVPGHNIKVIGTYSIEIKLYGNESAKLKLTVAPIEEAKEVTTEAPAAPAVSEVEADSAE
ncbi:50S ribosomal protein L9 [Thiospirochaeta perfilievii]|uniref:Large ribosomal subunit protein bL9 n=1 Tax=Thiospirochaeta perfilievii TaxID=252967 RepID=A0A5C1QHT1_9SPIO|nr:50S ribosomal protein L9 [Thiospirochaeta perfilievii]QEN06116.1 50S ribosomal protein L9 [Thiospirochaeta perfilievii]